MQVTEYSATPEQWQFLCTKAKRDADGRHERKQVYRDIQKAVMAKTASLCDDCVVPLRNGGRFVSSKKQRKKQQKKQKIVTPAPASATLAVTVTDPSSATPGVTVTDPSSVTLAVTETAPASATLVLSEKRATMNAIGVRIRGYKVLIGKRQFGWDQVTDRKKIAALDLMERCDLAPIGRNAAPPPPIKGQRVIGSFFEKVSATLPLVAPPPAENVGVCSATHVGGSSASPTGSDFATLSKRAGTVRPASLFTLGTPDPKGDKQVEGPIEIDDSEDES